MRFFLYIFIMSCLATACGSVERDVTTLDIDENWLQEIASNSYHEGAIINKEVFFNDQSNKKTISPKNDSVISDELVMLKSLEFHKYIATDSTEQRDTIAYHYSHGENKITTSILDNKTVSHTFFRHRENELFKATYLTKLSLQQRNDKTVISSIESDITQSFLPTNQTTTYKIRSEFVYDGE